MIVVDSFGWIEYFADGPLANDYARFLSDLSQIVTPAIVIYEVYKKIKRERREEDALIAVAQMQKTKVIPLDISISLSAADISLDKGLPMADAIVYATAMANNCEVATSDSHFAELPNVRFIKTSQ